MQVCAINSLNKNNLYFSSTNKRSEESVNIDKIVRYAIENDKAYQLIAELNKAYINQPDDIESKVMRKVELDINKILAVDIFNRVNQVENEANDIKEVYKAYYPEDFSRDDSKNERNFVKNGTKYTCINTYKNSTNSSFSVDCDDFKYTKFKNSCSILFRNDSFALGFKNVSVRNSEDRLEAKMTLANSNSSAEYLVRYSPVDKNIEQIGVYNIKINGKNVDKMMKVKMLDNKINSIDFIDVD